ncbi:type III secretion system export apparatus subunit SctV [Candidatus Glomeribacter gigasporarum]|nr:type III secretion system export apparatus subunit SctV [Candidatus Glomeribacter gigasporarum]
MKNFNDMITALLQAVSKRQDIVLVTIVITAVFMMILPLPTLLVDALIAINITLSVLTLMIAIYMRNPLDFSVFPALLLITTLYRLALTITTSRLILLQADAGEIIYAFGNFVVGGNVAVGIIIFAIITVVQFIVITKGAERVAEVSARFSLDGMPGRQMSIDGDMRAGALTATDAKQARELLLKESRFYGAMDGAMKFVKGDAIASIIVVIVNIVGGIAIGVMQQEMSAAQAISTYAILSVGDGLIAQIPALLISIAAGLIVTRIQGTEKENLATQMFRQLVAQPWALLMVSGVLVLFALLPGFPTVIFALLAAIIVSFWYQLRRRARSGSGARDAQDAQAPPPSGKAELPPALRVLLGPGVADHARLKETLERFCQIKFDVLGIHLAMPELVEKPEYAPGAVEIQLSLVPAVSLNVPAQTRLVWASARALEMEATEVCLPWGRVFSWLRPDQYEAAKQKGLTVHAAEQRIIELLDAVLARYAENFMGMQETRALFDALEKTHPELVREVLRAMPLHKAAEIMRRLIAEQIPVRDLRSVCEAIVNWSHKEKDVVLLTEYVRIALRRHVCHIFGGPRQQISALMIGERIEAMIRESIRETSAGTYSALPPDKTGPILNLIKAQLERHELLRPVLVTAMDVRRYLRKMIERNYFATPVLSNQELIDDLNVNVLGNIELFDESNAPAEAA